jgi:hypothetical protein
MCNQSDYDRPWRFVLHTVGSPPLSSLGQYQGGGWLGELLRHPSRRRMLALLLFEATDMGSTRVILRLLRENDSHFDEVTAVRDGPLWLCGCRPLRKSAISMRNC